MKNSTYLIFSIIKNIEKTKIDQVSDITKLLDKVNINWFNRSNQYTLNICKRIYNDIENGYYHYKDLMLFLYYELIFVDKFVFSIINKNNILNVKKIFSKEQLINDRKILNNINKSIGFKSIDDFINIQEDGSSILYHLIKEKNISPIIFLYFMYKNKLTFQNENIIIDSNYNKFINIMKIIYKILFNKHKEC